MITIDDLMAQSFAFGRARWGDNYVNSLSPSVMAFWGDTLDNFQVRGPARVQTFTGQVLDAWELVRLQAVTSPTWPLSPRIQSLWFAVEDGRELELSRVL